MANRNNPPLSGTESVRRDYDVTMGDDLDQGIPLTPAQLAWRDQRRAPGTAPTPRPGALARAALHSAIRQAREFDADLRFASAELPRDLPACVLADLARALGEQCRRVAEAAKELERALGAGQ